jgi:hypothetical protein
VEAAPPAVSVPAGPAAAPRAAPARETLLPNLDFYFPEGELDFKLNRLLKGSFYQGQLRYNFVKGDIEAYLRYRYYGYDKIFQLGLFDAVEFEPIEKGSNEFERTRGGLALVQKPFNYFSRAFFLGEVDRITSSKEEFQYTTNRTDTFVRVGYQLGTPDDVRLNAIVGETRGQRRNLFTAHREIGPFGAGFSAALTWGFKALLGDFDFVKLEVGGLKRFRLGSSAFLVSRLHGGSFLRKVSIRPELPETSADRYLIPREEFFRLDGRENLKGLEATTNGTEELHTTLELFLPWFVDERREALHVDWSSWYWLVYAGYGTIGFDRDVLWDSSNYLTDIGLGFEASFDLRDYTVFVAGIAAHTLDVDGAGIQARLTIKAVH